jgi:hypothetical protein
MEVIAACARFAWASGLKRLETRLAGVKLPFGGAARRGAQSERTGFEGQITISLRSGAQHPQGETQVRGICALTFKTPASEFLARPFGLRYRSLSPQTVRAEPVEAWL